jgi:hypothetical protein
MKTLTSLHILKTHLVRNFGVQEEDMSREKGTYSDPNLEIKNVWSYNSASLLCLPLVYMDSVTFL